MPGSLTPFLQEQFARHCPEGWTCRREVPLLSPALKKRLGYNPRADVLLEREDGSRRLWVEFEVSRADPVANHVKFATAHLFQPQPEGDAFVAMVSAHVVSGRRNLAAHAVLLMRHLGMHAFQTVLLPQFTGAEIKKYNHIDLESLENENLPVENEIERVLAVSASVGRSGDHRIFFAGDWFDVWGNVQRWNDELQDERMRQLWGRRTVTYFVFDPATEQFAPSKFCAFLRLPEGMSQADRVREEAGGWSTRSMLGMGMSVPFYVTLDENESRFDGAVARHHLEERLAMRRCFSEDVPRVARHFEQWIQKWDGCLRVHPRGPIFLLPPQAERPHHHHPGTRDCPGTC